MSRTKQQNVYNVRHHQTADAGADFKSLTLFSFNFSFHFGSDTLCTQHVAAGKQENETPQRSRTWFGNQEKSMSHLHLQHTHT